ncbi:MAG: zf-HC2 domain-containing protein, partial [Acidobacteriota bacterium]|nr:zf-HC2 domain-containing protein [Acidobacteriota bacterium]
MSFKGVTRLFGLNGAGHCRPLLSPYLDRELDERGRARVEAHLVRCAACRAECEELRAAAAVASRLRLPDAVPTAFPLWLKQQAPAAGAPP